MSDSSFKKIILAGGIILSLVLIACNDGSSGNTAQGISTQPGGGGLPVGQVSLSVYDPTGSLIYSASNSNTALSLTSGIQYNFQLNGTNVPAGTGFAMQTTNIDVINGTPTQATLSLGNNPFTPATPGDFLFVISPSAPTTPASIASQTYQASVVCANPSFSASSLTASGISVAAGSGTNLYNYSAAAVVSSANGMSPYLCAWDLDGDGIQDTPFSPCASGVSNVYVNYLGTRNVGLIVKDACNTSQTVSNSVNLAYTIPSMPGNVFIYGQNTNATGTAAGDSRIDGVNYFATNSGGNNIVKPLYAPGANGQGSFTITSTLNYGILSSVNFGMELDVGNISDTLNVSTMTGTVDASNASLNKTNYSTDEEGDETPSQSLSGTPCTLTNPGVKVTFQQGTPCSAGTTGDNNNADVEVWGNYTCTVSDASGSSLLTGSFDGIAHLADNCVGGGGGGGGGITPIGL